MKTQKEILHELVHEDEEKLAKDPQWHTERIEEALKKSVEDGDLMTFTAANLASALAKETVNPLYLTQTENNRRTALFKTIFMAFTLTKKAERLYGEQIHVGEENGE